MKPLIHLIYSSAATRELSEEDLIYLLDRARTKNSKLDVTGMLLYAEGSFFQVLEGDAPTVDELFRIIAQDERHTQVVTIIREPIPTRSFGEWSMSYSTITPQDVAHIVGLNDYFTQASCFGQINPGRAKKLLTAFKKGRWRTRLSNVSRLATSGDGVPTYTDTAMPGRPNISHAFQPIIDVNTRCVVSFEALLRGPNNESVLPILQQLGPIERFNFHTKCRAVAIGLAARLGLRCDLNLSFTPTGLDDTETAICSTLDSAKAHGLDPSRITLQIDQNEFSGSPERFAQIINEYRSAGLKTTIDHLGAGRAGLSLLESYLPDMITLNEFLVRGIHTNGPRQAIVSGVTQVCLDLGIDIIAKGIQVTDEYRWLHRAGINLFQGDLFARPAFEQLPPASYPQE
ncbi:MAG: diguanylate phosphodiesterase [Candidatus Thiodiazotropha sp. (ex Lucinoma borealis)]|nr:diguanylate phosphodiesterase [Candidatus Thiodiazotropha sp. (ex Lucinoma borealis)]